MSEEKANLHEITGDTAISGVKADVRRRAALGLVQMIYRLAKACLLHSDSNQAVLSLVPSAIDSIVEYCELSGSEAATLVFAGNTLFLNGQMLRASRDTYEVALELGSFFEACDVSELVLEKTVRRAELAAFARLLADAQRDRSIAARLLQSNLRGVRVRKLTNPFPAGAIEGDGTRIGRISRTYAAAILVMRSFYAALRSSEPALPQRVKRVAQRLVAAAEEDARLLLSVAAGKVADPDEAGLSVSTAIVALGIARQLTTDRRMLGSLVTAALLYDVSRLRLTGALAGPGDGEEPGARSLLERSLSDDEKERLPASAAVMLTALGKLHAPSITRTVIAYEALGLRPGGRPGLLYGGRRSPTVLARILAAARQFTELRSAPFPAIDGASSGGSSLDAVLQRMLAGAESATDRAIAKLLVGALGIIPTGTFVQLSTGELGVVLSTPSSPARFAQPPVRVLFDEQGHLLAAPFDVDLAQRAPGAEPCFIVRPVEVEPHHERAIRAAFGFRSGRGAAGVESRVTAVAPVLFGDEVPPTEPGDTLAPRAIRAAEEAARGAPSRKEAAWLGRPLAGSAHGAPPVSVQPRQPASAERPPAERGRNENLISTQPPPSTAAAAAPAVPPPPRLPRDSRPFGQVPSTRYAVPPTDPTARSSRRIERRDDAPSRDPGVGQLPTIGPPAAFPASRRSGDARLGPPTHRSDSRADPESCNWDDELPTIDPPPLLPPPTSRSPSFAPERPPSHAPDRAPGYAPDRAPSYVSDRAPGYASDRAPSYVSDRAPSYASDRAPGYVSDRAPGYASDRAPGYASDRAPSPSFAPHTLDRTISSGVTPGRGFSHPPDRGSSSGVTPGRGFSHPPDRGSSSGVTPGRGFSHSPDRGSSSGVTPGRGFGPPPDRGSSSGVTPGRGFSHPPPLDRGSSSGVTPGRGFSHPPDRGSSSGVTPGYPSDRPTTPSFTSSQGSGHPPDRTLNHVPEAVATERNASRGLSSASSAMSLEEADLTWTDELPTLDPPPAPPSTEELERDRLLAAYLAERTPLPEAGPHEWNTVSSPLSPGLTEAEADVRRRGGPPSQHAAPDSLATPPMSSSPFGASRRPPRAPIPREEPDDVASSPPTSQRRDR
ncbi:hypothetical protein [Sorangium sp. So ce1024]|uniref:hypothetical protein n=1 Tax=Sorangium sp. So ce1024 TaxID=3133327 RepID=UPI003F04EA08